MLPGAMEPYGRALVAYLEGDSSAELLVRRDDGKVEVMPIAPFFREESALSALEQTALALCAGRVLDIGAGAGALSLVLQRRGCLVTAIDISPEAVAVARRRGVQEAFCADILAFGDGPFDTLLMLGHGVGMVETVEGLDRFLAHARRLVTASGALLLDSVDVRRTSDPEHLDYHAANRKAGRYIGEIRMQFAFRGQQGPSCGWLHVDADTLQARAGPAGWRCDVVHQGESGDYLARLRLEQSP